MNCKNMLKTIDFSAFENMAINSIDLPASVEEIGVKAFNNSFNQKIINFQTDSKLDKISKSAFSQSVLDSNDIPQ